MENYSIRDLENLCGVKAYTIRVWERRYGILEQHRTKTNRRRYGDTELRKIINISILNRNGFKISAIANLTDAEIEEKVSLLAKDTNHKDNQIDSLTKTVFDHNEKAINEILVRNILNKGIETTFTGIVFPFLRKIGTMWHTGNIDVGSEHFITNIFRQRIISAIDSLPFDVKSDSKKVILFLPENELHELGLLFFNYLIRKAGHQTLYLGQSTPLATVAQINKSWNADIIVTGLMSGFPDILPSDFVSQLDSAFPGKIILLGGLGEIRLAKKSSNILQINSFDDLKNFL